MKIKKPKDLEIYRFVSWYRREKNNFVVCFGEGQYEVIRNFGKYIVSNHWMSGEEAIEFIHNQSRAINAETSTGIEEIKRVKFKQLPRLVRQAIRESIKDS